MGFHDFKQCFQLLTLHNNPLDGRHTTTTSTKYHVKSTTYSRFIDGGFQDVEVTSIASDSSDIFEKRINMMISQDKPAFPEPILQIERPEIELFTPLSPRPERMTPT